MDKKYEHFEDCLSCGGSGTDTYILEKYNREYEKYNRKLFDLSTSNEPWSFNRYNELLCNPPTYPNTTCKKCNGSGKVIVKSSLIQILADIKDQLTKIERKMK